MRHSGTIAIIGGGLAGALVALEAADRGAQVVLYEASGSLLHQASRANEGKIHLGYTYAGDRSGRTARRMIEGALAFRPTLERWMSAADLDDAVTRPFDYVVPVDSQRPPAEIAHHFSMIETLLSEIVTPQDTYLGHKPDRRWNELIDPPYRMGPDDLLAAFETQERAVDTHLIADRIRDAVMAHPRIETRLDTPVSSYRETRAGWRLLHKDTAQDDGPFARIVNAAWAERRLIDSRSGYGDAEKWFTRYKFTVTIHAGSANAKLRNFTAILGSYGDIVAFGNGRLYLSWYPSLMNLATADISAPAPVPGLVDQQRMYRDTRDRLTHWYPLMADLPEPDFEAGKVVDGGFIIARGTTDISDQHSQLHERHAIGISEPARGCFSFDGGKYTTVPLLALACADLIAAERRVHAAV